MPELFPRTPCIKGAVPYCLDQMSVGANARQLLQNLHTEIDRLEGVDFHGLELVFDRHLFVPVNFGADKGSQATQYLQRYWFDANSKDLYFKEFQPIAPVYARGVLKTLELALKGRPDSLPIDCWWLTGYPHVEMINLLSGQQVTLIIATPKPEVQIQDKFVSETANAWSTVRGVVTRKLP